jgi:cell division protease FtsH
MMQAEEILKQNKLVLLKIGEYLTIHSRMEEEMIAQFVKTYSVEEWVRVNGFIKKEDYYDFHTKIQKQIEELETNGVEQSVGNLVNSSVLM